ncbi:MAG: protein kinase [Pirellulaceae bacterium]|nr:protein kinase [Pirellulaceae bacterium]
MTDPVVAIERSEPLHAPPGDLETGVLIGDFRIERRLGAGGMGIVYQARQVSLNRPVALKVLGQALSRGTDVSRFQREAQATARLQHPSIAQVYYIGQDRHICYMAMELVDGISLRRVLDRLGTTTTADTGMDTAVQEDLAEEPEASAIRFDVPTEALHDRQVPPDAPPPTDQTRDSNPYLSPMARELRTGSAHVRRCTEVVRDAAHALAHAHEQGVVHRDIKPDNLLLSRKGKLHLIDFGLARFFEDQAVTYTGQLVGTPLYMSPEQVTGRGAIDARTDIYSLGLVLYELLTLRPPVEATNRENLLRNIVTKPLPPVSWRNSAVPEDLARIVHRATQKDPDQRYASAAEMAADLDRFLAGKSVAAPQYYFRLDEREITAARPGGIVLAAFIICLVALGLSLGIASVGLMMAVMFIGGANAVGVMVLAMQSLVATVILVGGVFVSRGLLAAHAWARWTGVVLFALLGLGAAFGLVSLGIASVSVSAEVDSLTQQAKAEKAKGGAAGTADEELPFPIRNFVYGMFAMYALPLLVGLLLGGAGIWSLVTRKASEWFAFAVQIRLEHRSMKEQFQ